ncbi:Hypothetical predicted protein [Mytilus galloprovincialis]|uniref:Uncharacterized protein n=1 Tax=Mytilus galloprovincialis TaxID=29158 RepID=A0A8B6FZ55_MYTGA|nr:Hypothetical predicted protein [Mytilus galloprovincialis]
MLRNYIYRDETIIITSATKMSLTGGIGEIPEHIKEDAMKVIPEEVTAPCRPLAEAKLPPVGSFVSIKGKIAKDAFRLKPWELKINLGTDPTSVTVRRLTFVNFENKIVDNSREKSSHRIQQQEASSRVTPCQPTSTFAYPFPPTPLQPQAVAYKQSAVFIHPSLNAFRQPLPSPPAGSCQQIYECEEVVPTGNYPQKRGFTHTTDYIQQTVTPAVIDAGIKKNRYENISPAPYALEANTSIPENVLDNVTLFHLS